MTPERYRKKPVVVEAMRLTGGLQRYLQIQAWLTDENMDTWGSRPPNSIRIRTLEGTIKASRGDYIIKGVQGEFYPCKPDIFRKTYTKVSE